MRLNIGQITPLTTELAALERLKNRCHHVISVDIDPLFFKLAGNKDMHNIMNEFEFRPDRTTDYGVMLLFGKKGKTRDFSETIVICYLKLATDDLSDENFLLISKFCPLGAVRPLPRGYIHQVSKPVY